MASGLGDEESLVHINRQKQIYAKRGVAIENGG